MARAFVITDAETLAPFTLDRVLDAVSSGRGMDWLETLMSELPRAQRETTIPLAGFIATPEEQGYWRPAGRSDWSHVRAIAIVNRFDLMPADYSHCGEYRLIFARRTEHDVRLHIAIEINLRNPYPEKRRAGCVDIAEFWNDLARTESADARRSRLQRFFFGGVAPFGPVLDAREFEQRGRIRTSEISNARPKFRQFELQRGCANGRPCVPRLLPTPLDNTPDAALFAADTARAAAFRRAFLRQVASLSIADVNRYFMAADRAYSLNAVDAELPPVNYRLPFRRFVRTSPGREFREQIARELMKAGSDLTPEDILARAETQNCAGCHAKLGGIGGGLTFPEAFDSGEHIADVSISGAVRLSAALQDVFLPYRVGFLHEYLRATGEDDRNSEPGAPVVEK